MYTLWLYFRGYSKEFVNVSKADIKVILKEFTEHSDFYGYDIKRA